MNAPLCSERVCIVTGAGRGLGREYALSLAREGAHVVVNDLGGAVDGAGRSLGPAQAVVDEITAFGGEAVADGHDISSWSGAQALIATAVEHFGALDVVINNAGILRDATIVTMPEDAWDAVMQVHLKGTFLTSKAAAAYWRGQAKHGSPRRARLINTTSASGIYGNPGQSNYGAAKAGIASFTVIAAMELERYGVTANAVAPLALTRMTEGLKPVDDDRRAKRSPRWVSPIVTWLASEGSDDVTGRVFEASGDCLAVAEGWRRGPIGPPVGDPHDVAAVVEGLLAGAAPNSTMAGTPRVTVAKTGAVAGDGAPE